MTIWNFGPHRLKKWGGDREITTEFGLSILPNKISENSEFSTSSFTVKPGGEPQTKVTKYYLVNQANGDRTCAGKVHRYGSRRGLSRSSDLLIFDRHAAENTIGIWVHFMWPTVMAESNGRYISINVWDRAQVRNSLKLPAFEL